jgi:hypothetical protein
MGVARATEEQAQKWIKDIRAINLVSANIAGGVSTVGEK